MLCFGAVGSIVNRPPRPIAASVAIALVGVVVWLAARACRGGRELPGWLTAVVLLAIPVCCLGGLRAIDFGRSDVTDWPTIVVTALPVILLFTRRSRIPFAMGIGALILPAAIAAIVVWQSAPSAAAVIPAGTATQVAVLAGLMVFGRMLDSVSARYQQATAELSRDRSDAAAQERIAEGRTRWTRAGVHAALTVLRRIAAGEVSPADPGVQRECVDAEERLRHVLTRSVVTHLGPWMDRVLARARARSVLVVLRSGDVDAPDESIARSFGEVALAAVDATPVGAELNVAIFPRGGGVQLVLVGPRDALQGIGTVTDLPVGYTFAVHQYDENDVVEIAPRPSMVRASTESGGEVAEYA